MEHFAPSVFPQEARQGPQEEDFRGTLGFLQPEPVAEEFVPAAIQLLEDMDSGARFMRGILLGALLSGSMWAGILLLLL